VVQCPLPGNVSVSARLCQISGVASSVVEPVERDRNIVVVPDNLRVFRGPSLEVYMTPPKTTASGSRYAFTPEEVASNICSAHWIVLDVTEAIRQSARPVPAPSTLFQANAIQDWPASSVRRSAVVAMVSLPCVHETVPVNQHFLEDIRAELHGTPR
jgi:hypothetical protein